MNINNCSNTIRMYYWTITKASARSSIAKQEKKTKVVRPKALDGKLYTVIEILAS